MLSYGGRCDGRWQNCFVIETLGLRHPVAANIYHVCFTKLLRTKNSLHMYAEYALMSRQKSSCGGPLTMKLWQAIVVSAALLVITPLSHADPVPTVHCAPDENLEHIDVEIIDTAKSSVGAVARSSKAPAARS
jgi:hypothetical protein